MLDLTKLKALAYKSIIMGQIMELFFYRRVENMGRKGEIAGYQHFLHKHNFVESF